VALALVVSAGPGCATVFTGTSQKITVETNPPGATVIVIGSPMASVLLAGGKSTEVTRRVLGVLGPMVSDATRRRLEILDFDELVTRLVLWSRDRVPPEVEGGAAMLPPEVKTRLLGVLGVKGVGDAPYSLKLKKGRKYAVIAFQDGYQARTAGIQMKFNWVFVLNVFNAFLLSPVDIVTGAWFKLSPGTLRLELRPAGGNLSGLQARGSVHNRLGRHEDGAVDSGSADRRLCDGPGGARAEGCR
jgi:hypothetical protein